MKISEQLFQFPERSLILVMDGQVSRVFFAFNGLLSELEKIRVPKQRYTDREGRFQTSGRGQTSGGGAPIKDIKDITFHHFLQKLSVEVERRWRRKKPGVCFLCAPKHLLPSIKEKLPSDVQKRIKLEIAADLIHAHPKEIVERITSTLR